jgi:protein-L-isoaspartate(D-aspartate) O-methyltransferase
MIQKLRNDLVNRLMLEGSIVTAHVEAAMRSIPRETFASWISVKEAYKNRAITNPATLGNDISTISQPSAVARFLEGFDLKPGMNILEIGAGTGYQAALISHIIGDSGKVTTIDIAEPLIDKARQNLSSLGISNVDVILGDGVLGFPEAAPYDRIVATVGLREIPLVWIPQLKDDGHIVVPLHVGGGPANHILVNLKREGLNLVGRGIDLLDMVVLRGPHAEINEQIKRGSDWKGGYPEALWIQVLPKDLSLEPSVKQKLIHKNHTTVLVEVI